MKIRQKPTIIDVAKRANVSIATVSYVLNNKPIVKTGTRDRVLEAIKTLDYQPNLEARRLGRSQRESQARRKTNSILFLTYKKAEPIFERDYMEGFLDAVERFNYKIMIGRASNPQDYAMNIHNQDVDGIITNIMLPEMVMALSKVCPLVLLGSFVPAGGVNSVVSDNRDGIRQVIRHLVELGHRSIGFASSDPAHPCYRERESEYRAALAEHKLACNDRFVHYGYDINACLNQRPLPTAIVCTNDGLAATVLRALSEMNVKVPGQVSVTGFDDIDIARHISPPLTTVHVPRAKLAALAVEQLIGKINNPALGDYRIMAPVELCVRESTGPLSMPSVSG